MIKTKIVARVSYKDFTAKEIEDLDALVMKSARQMNMVETEMKRIGGGTYAIRVPAEILKEVPFFPNELLVMTISKGIMTIKRKQVI